MEVRHYSKRLGGYIETFPDASKYEVISLQSRHNA